MKKSLYPIIALFLIAMFSKAQSSITWNAGVNVNTSATGNGHPRIVVDRNGNPPFDIAGDSPVFEAFFQIALRQPIDVGTPIVLLVAHPLFKLLLESAQLEEEVLGLSGNRGRPAYPAIRIEQVGGV